MLSMVYEYMNKTFVRWILLYWIREGAIEKNSTLTPTLMPPIENVKVVVDSTSLYMWSMNVHEHCQQCGRKI